MKLNNVCAVLLLIGNALCASADKPTWTPARPTQPAPKTGATASSVTAGAQRVPEKTTWVSATPTKKPSATIGQHRAPEPTPAPAPKKTSHVAIETAGKAAPEIIKGLPGVIQSIHAVATGGTTSASTPTPSTSTQTTEQPELPKKSQPAYYYELGQDEEETEGE